MTPPFPTRRASDLARIADQRDEAAVLTPRGHLLGEFDHADQVSARRWADAAPQSFGKEPRGGKARRILHLDHPVDDMRLERRLDPRPPDPLDPDARVGDEVGAPAAPAFGEHRSLGVDHRPHRHLAAPPVLAHIPPERRRGAARAHADTAQASPPYTNRTRDE